jgi:hypothetical protein
MGLEVLHYFSWRVAPNKRRPLFFYIQRLGPVLQLCDLPQPR